MAIRTPPLAAARASVYPFPSLEQGAPSRARPHAPHLQCFVLAIHPLHATLAAPVPGRVLLAARGVKSTHLPPSPPPLSRSPSSAPVAEAAELVRAADVGNGTGRGSQAPARSLPLAPGRGFPRAELQTRRCGWLGGAAADAVDITAESARLPGRCGDPSAPQPPPPAPAWRLGGTAAGGGEQGAWGRVGLVLPPSPPSR